ncbi:hypothetical protein ACP3VU_19230 [Vibrio sp. PNB23_22_6]
MIKLVEVRRELLELVRTTSDSNSSYNRWDNTKSNSTTKRELIYIKNKLLSYFSDNGGHVVSTYTSCPHDSHIWKLSCSSVEDLKYNDTRFNWFEEELVQGEEYGICPCHGNDLPTVNHVYKEFIFDRQAECALGQQFYELIRFIYKAIEASQDNRARSAIRENILMAILIINDLLLSESMDVIAARIENKT